MLAHGTVTVAWRWSHALYGGASVLVAATLSNGHAVCITEDANTATVYLDGKFGQSGTVGSTTFGGVGLVNGRLIIGGSLLTGAEALRITFCDGTTLEVHPVNTGEPRYVFADVPATGDFNRWKHMQSLDASGQPYGPDLGQGAAGCERRPPDPNTPTT